MVVMLPNRTGTNRIEVLFMQRTAHKQSLYQCENHIAFCCDWSEKREIKPIDADYF